jgi:hypothetical protein
MRGANDQRVAWSLVTARGAPRDSTKDTNICRHGEGDEWMKEPLRSAAAADVVRLRLVGCAFDAHASEVRLARLWLTRDLI